MYAEWEHYVANEKKIVSNAMNALLSYIAKNATRYQSNVITSRKDSVQTTNAIFAIVKIYVNTEIPILF